MKTEILKHWRGKIGYCFTFKDLDEIRQLIDYYEKENQKYRTLSNRAMKVAFESVLEKYKEIIGEHE